MTRTEQAISRFADAQQLAQTIDNTNHGGRWWTANQKKLENIIALLVQEVADQLGESLDQNGVVSTLKRDEVAAWVTGYIMRFDDTYGWDAPRMDEAVEDFFYTAMVRFAIGAEVSRRTMASLQPQPRPAP